MTRPDKWDIRFIGLAKHVSQWSKDPSTQVGAVIVDQKHRVISLGFNGFARGVRDLAERLENREMKYDMIIHAERNAVLFANAPVDGASVYVWPLLPCAQCAATLIQAGGSEIVAPAADSDRAERWAAQIILARTMFEEAGIKVFELENYPVN
ncbi:MAG: CMP deaminase [Rhodospirillaceae bacterium]|nr:CMP deaminase [Rhodospirillaceae bacterium]